MFFVATRDFLIAFILSVFYVLLIDGVFHENRNFSFIKDFQPQQITQDEYKKAQDIIAAYEKQNTPQNQNNNLYDQYLNNIYNLRNI